MTKIEAHAAATAYANSFPSDYRTRIVPLATRYVVLTHRGVYRGKRTFRFTSAPGMGLARC